MDAIYLVNIKPFNNIYGTTDNLINNWKFKINDTRPYNVDTNITYYMTDNTSIPNTDTRLYVNIEPSLPQPYGSHLSKLTFIEIINIY